MSEKGWIKLHRKIIDNYLWTKKPFSEGQAWIDLLLLANHEDKKALQDGEIKIFKRGTVNRSIASLSERWGWDRRKTTRFLRVLESDEMLSVNSTTHGTTVTIINYSFYNDIRTTECTTDAQPNVQPNVQPLPTNKNEKNDKNEKKSKRKCIKESQEQKKIFGEYRNVKLTDEELSKLQNEFEDWEQRIERLSGYIASKGDKYKSHFATIRNWAIEDEKKGMIVPRKTSKDSNPYGREYKDGLLVWNIKFPESEHPPYYGAPPEWFEDGELVLDRVTGVYQPKEFKFGFFEPKVLTKEDVLEEITFRKEYFEKHGETDS